MKEDIKIKGVKLTRNLFNNSSLIRKVLFAIAKDVNHPNHTLVKSWLEEEFHLKIWTDEEVKAYNETLSK